MPESGHSPTPDARSLLTAAGDLILPCQLGHYRVTRKLGRGGMGQVYLAEEPALNRRVALKVLPQELARDANYVRRFLHEAQSIAKMVHPGIVGIHYIGRFQTLVFFAMEYVEGETLADRLKRDQRISVVEALEMSRQVSEALEYALEMDIVHRDIKPANLFFNKKGKVKVGDFGLAKGRLDDLSLTQSGTVVGSPYYMSPEQGFGKQVDHRSDIYSLGATLYHAVSGQPPFDAETPVEMVMRHVNDAIKPIEALPPGVREQFHWLMGRMMAKSPDDRFRSYKELIQETEALRESLEAKARTDHKAQTMLIGEPGAGAPAPAAAAPGPEAAMAAPEPTPAAGQGSLSIPAQAAATGWRLFAMALLVVVASLATLLAVRYYDLNTGGDGPGEVTATPTATPNTATEEPAPTPSAVPQPTGIATPQSTPTVPFSDPVIASWVGAPRLKPSFDGYFFTVIKMDVEQQRNAAPRDQRAQMDAFLRRVEILAQLKKDLTGAINGLADRTTPYEISPGRKIIPGSAKTDTLTYAQGPAWKPETKAWGDALKPAEFYALAGALLRDSPAKRLELFTFALTYQLEMASTLSKNLSEGDLRSIGESALRAPAPKGRE